MNITYRTDKSILYIAIEGRIDASNAATAEAEILAIRKANEGKHTVIDADNLEYISSAGLRVILKIRKEEPKLAIINVAPDVYDVFDMTGFTDMITVEKAYKRTEDAALYLKRITERGIDADHPTCRILGKDAHAVKAVVHNIDEFIICI